MAPLRAVLACACYGVGSANEPPKMSVFPKVGQTLFGAGRAGSVELDVAVPFAIACRYASIAGQSVAKRASFQTATANAFVATV